MTYSRQNIRYSIGVALLSTCFCARALTYQWPIAVSVTVNVTSEVRAVYTMTMDSISINDDAITESTLATDVLKKYVGVSSVYSWGGYHRHNWGGTLATAKASATAADTLTNSSTTTFKDWANHLSTTYGHGVLTEIHAGSANGNECVGTSTWGAEPGMETFDTWIATTWNGNAGAFGNCIGTPPPHEWCALVQPTITLSHGTQMLRDAHGHQSETPVTVHCTAAMKYTLRLQGYDNIPLDNGMVSIVTAAGIGLGSTLQGTAGDQSVTISSTLKGSPQTAGAFMGSGVLMVSYP